ncbi:MULTISPECIES: hypothetical protein [unclassified Brevundimonas]|uniref:hypothetical protein n=1 Tax=unclassified Brevundimonas TaxID=2622653 RepID=UPI0020059F5B|nr:MULTISPECIES: hypothetical protein [unclassified Brevundimonas]MCK6104741.1 hypothetical protein [Brevundimonas sp. EYE_349]
MSDDEHITAPAAPDDLPSETSAQKALRLKTARIDARPKPPRGGRFQREQNAKIAAGKSRPWMSK